MEEKMDEKEIRAIVAQAALYCRSIQEFADEKKCSRQNIDALVNKGALDSCYFRQLKCVLMTEHNQKYLEGD